MHTLCTSGNKDLTKVVGGTTSAHPCHSKPCAGYKAVHPLKYSFAIV